ncbi:MAG TPA: hypothetical protein VF268_00495 [Gammaproteobacteria bacterium]
MQNLTIDIAKLKENLGEKYSALVIDNPRDAVEYYVNRKLQAFAGQLGGDTEFRRITEHKLDGFLAMTRQQRLAVAVNDMHKRMMAIPPEYEPLIPGYARKNFQRDIITSPKAVARLLLIYGIPYTLLVLIIGILIGRCLAIWF